MHKQLPAEDQQIVPFNPAIAQVRDAVPAGYSYMPLAASDSGTSLAVYWQVLLRRRWIVVAVAVIATALASFYSLRTKPVYKSVASIEVEPDTPQVQTLNEVYQQPQGDQDGLRTQIQILQTDNLAWRTIEQLGLAQNPTFAGPGASRPPDSDARKVQLIKMFQGPLSAELLPGTRIIRVGFESTDPHLAARIVNGLVQNYTEYSFRQKYDATREAAGRMEQQLDELKAKVENSQRDLGDYQRKHAIVDDGGKQSVIEQRLSQLSTDLTQAQSDRIAKEAIYNQWKSNPELVAASSHDDLLHRLQEKQADLHSQYVQALDTYGPNYPKVVRLNREMEEAAAQITAERKRAIEHYYNDYLAARNREQLLSQAVAQQKEELGNFNQLLVEHNILKGEFETNQQLYQKLLQRLKDATVTAGLRSTNIHVVDAALPPTGPIRPRTKFNIAAGLFIGLVLGVVLAFVREAADSSLKAPEDVELLLATPALALIPSESHTGMTLLLLPNGAKKPGSNGNGHRPGHALSAGGMTARSEAYRALRTSVLLSTPSQPPQTMLITSSTGSEGKTTTAVNLALALAQCDSPVVLIDCDLRRPSAARILNIPNRKGMSTYLTGNNKADDVIQQYTAEPNLWIIPSGPIPPNPAELVSSPMMVTLLHELSGRFKYIIVDSPPLLAVTDATILSTLVDGCILIVESGVTPKKMILRACKMLSGANARLLGVVLNKIRVHHDGYYDVYYRGYYHEERETE
jgi:succinoglycan biosynthesis transport protein ExoP